MASVKHEARKTIMLNWLASDECSLSEAEKEELRVTWETPCAFPSMEKAIWNATRDKLKNVEDSPIDDMKTVDAVRAGMGEDLVKMENDLFAFYENYSEHLRQKGKNGVFAEFDSAEHYVEDTMKEIIRRLR